VSVRFEGRVALVTGGAGSGIGGAVCRRLAAEGSAVVVMDDHERRTDETVERLRAESPAPVMGAPVSVADRGAVDELVRRVAAELGPIDVLVNNAAAGPYRPFEKLSLRAFEVTFAANVRAPLLLARLVAPEMRARRRGWIVNVSSATAEPPQGPPYGAWEREGGMHLYGASKAALNRLTAGLAAELHADGIAVNALAPVAAVITPGVEALGATRWIEPSMIEPIEAIAEAALALATCEPSLTGRVTYSLPLLRELAREIRTLDGESAL